MSTQGTSNLIIVNGMPSAKRLDNGRFRLEFFCDPSNKSEGWYKGNIDKWLPAFGALQDHKLDNSWSYPKNSDVTYDNMHLIEAGVEFIPSASTHYVVLAYETLTGSFVADKDEDIDFELNGLQRVTRTFVALPETAYTKVVGVDTIVVGGITLFLGSYSIKETDAKWELTETWLEAGELSRSEDFADSRGALTITQIGGCPTAPDGFTAVKEDKNNTLGFETCTVTFYEDDAVLSRSNDFVGSQLAEVVEVFNPSTEPTPTTGGTLAKQDVSDVDGIPTTRYTFLVPSILTVTQDFTDASTTITVQAFNLTSAVVDTALSEVTANHKLIAQKESDFEGIETISYTYELESYDIIDTERNGLRRVLRTRLLLAAQFYASEVGITTIQHEINAGTPTTLYLAGFKIDDTVTFRKVTETWMEAGQLSEGDPVTGTDRIRVKTSVWQMVQGADPTGYVESSVKTDNVDGFKTISVTYFFLDDLEVSYVYETTVPFTVPGTVDVRESTFGGSGGNNLMLDVKPPISTLCEAVITESYTTDATIDTSGIYQPNKWTGVIIEGVGRSFRPFSSTSTFINHIALSTGGNATTPSIGTLEYIQGNLIFANTTGYIRIDGPSDDIAGTTIEANITLTPVFRLFDATQYYKKVVTQIKVPSRP